MNDIIPFDDFAKVDLRIGKVIESTSVPESTKLVRLTVDFAEESNRTVFTGLLAWYEPEWFVDKLFVFVANLLPRKMMGEESQGMLLSVSGEEKPIPVEAPEGAKAGDSLR